MIEIWMKNHLLGDNICNIYKTIVPTFVFHELTMYVRCTLVLVTLHERCAISIEQNENENW